MPTHPTPHLVVTQTRLTLSRSEELLDPVTLTLGTHYLDQRNLRIRVRERILDPRLTHIPHHHQTFLRPHPTLLFGPDQHRHRLDLQRPLLRVPHGQSLPPRRRLTVGPIIDPLERHLTLAAHAGLLPGRSPLLEVAHQRVARHIQDVTLLPRPQLRTELGNPTELVIACDPTVGQIGQASAQQIQRDLPLLPELDRRGDVTLLAPNRVRGPLLGQVELSVQRGVAGLRGVNQEDADLARFDLAQSATPLASDPTGIGSLLGERTRGRWPRPRRAVRVLRGRGVGVRS